MVIDIQDIGCRYYTFISSISYLFDALVEMKSNMEIYVLDRPNPAGRQVEGSRIKAQYTSFIGIEGLPHRHGLSIGEVCLFMKNQKDMTLGIQVIEYDENDIEEIQILPSPNFPSVKTAKVYSGQCLFEGTNLSEERYYNSF